MPETDRADANEIFPFHVRTVLDFGTKEDYLCRNLEPHMEIQDKVISLENEIECFNRYFEANSRCILSAPFGEGKSFFLNEFIKKKCDEYDFITLYPTNYQVCDNKDIFEYIKRDVLLGLLSLEPKFMKDLDRSKAELIRESILECKDGIISCLPEINIGVHGIADCNISTAKIINIVRQIIEKCRKRRLLNGNPLKEYFNRLEEDLGSIYEFNPISNLISDLISTRKRGNGSAAPRKVVLVIEDLDRIDPEHIFRILNIFSAHLADDSGEGFSQNKFGFDKVLLICDYDNIKNIYQHLYGANADFQGYISKFTAKGIYSYSLRSQIKDYMLSLIPDSLRNTFPSIISLIVNEIFDKYENLKGENLRTTKIKFTEYKSAIIIEDFFFNEYKMGAFIKTDKIELMHLLALAKLFKIDLSALLEEYPQKYHGYELYNLCWPYIIIKDGRLPSFQPITYSEDSAECLNGHRIFIVEHEKLEITSIKHVIHYNCIGESYLKEAYDFIKKCETFID